MKYLTINKHWDLVQNYNIDKLLYLLIDRSNVETDYYIYWKNNKGQDHRDYDLPSFMWVNGNVFWRKYGWFHRENNKPAYINNDGYKEYYINGKRKTYKISI